MGHIYIPLGVKNSMKLCLTKRYDKMFLLYNRKRDADNINSWAVTNTFEFLNDGVSATDLYKKCVRLKICCTNDTAPIDFYVHVCGEKT